MYEESIQSQVIESNIILRFPSICKNRFYRIGIEAVGGQEMNEERGGITREEGVGRVVELYWT